MGRYPEFVDPYDTRSANLFIRAEHLARYLYAVEFVRKRKLKRVLDCACGNGYGSLLLESAAESVDAVDYNGLLIEQGRRAYSEAKVGGIRFHQADLNSGIGMMEDCSCDCAVCFETLEHIEREEHLLRELARVIRKSHWLLLSVPKEGYEPVGEGGTPDNPWHVRLYTLERILNIVKHYGFVVERILGQPYTNILRANTESYRRNQCLHQEDIDAFFVETPSSLRYFASVWGWPVPESEEKSSVLFLVCRKAR